MGALIVVHNSIMIRIRQEIVLRINENNFLLSVSNSKSMPGPGAASLLGWKPCSARQKQIVAKKALEPQWKDHVESL